MTIKLHIDRLVLEGDAFTRMDRTRLAAAVQTQLAALLRDGTDVDTFAVHHGAAAIRAGNMTSKSDGHGPRDGAARVPARATAVQWGDHIARAVHGALASNVHGEPQGRRDADTVHDGPRHGHGLGMPRAGGNRGPGGTP